VLERAAPGVSTLLMGLDLATRTGWAIGPPGGRPVFGAKQFDPTDPEGKLFRDLAIWLEGQIERHGITYLVTEEFYTGQSRLVVARLFGLRSVAKMVAYENNVRYRELRISAIARRFTGQGRFPRGDKKAVTIAAAKALGYDVGDDHDMADAIAIWTVGDELGWPKLAAARGVGPLFAAGRL
jgi:crossover junction endodeoxyribonuclease RuvC